MTDCSIKLLDFGLAKVIPDAMDVNATIVQTLSYRAPELFVQYAEYTNAIDLWSVGCIMAEFYTDPGPFFPGATDVHVLYEIMRTVGPPPDSFMARAPHNVREFVSSRGIAMNMLNMDFYVVVMRVV